MKKNITKQAQRICATLQKKHILKKRWRDADRKRWDFAISVILKERQNEREN